MRLLRVFATVLSLGLSACGAPAEDTPTSDYDAVTSQAGEFQGEFHLRPATIGENSLEFRLERDGTAVSNAEVELELWMPAHGHTSPVTPRVRDLGNGRYLAENVVFNMPGTWECRVTVTVGRVRDRFVVPTPVR
jgi:hypothetical protein